MDRRAAGIRGAYAYTAPDSDLPRSRRCRRARVRRPIARPRPGRARLADHRRSVEPARRAATRGARRPGPGRADDRGRSGPLLPAHRGPRRLDHGLLGPSARAFARSRRDHALALRPARWPGPQLPAPADGRLGLRRRASLHLRRRPRRPDRLPAQALLDRPRSRGDPAPAAPGAAPEPGPEGHGHPVEPARVDEDERLAGRRALQGRPARLRRLRAVFRALRPGVPARRRPDRRRHAAERAPEPQPERLSGHGPARRRGGAARRRGRPRLPARRDPHEDPRLRPQLVAAPQRRRPARRSGQPGVRGLAALQPGRAATTSPGPPSTATRATPSASRPSTTPSRRRTSTSPSARARCRATRRPRSPTPCTGTPASSPSARSATGPRRSSRGTSRSTRPAVRTTAAAARASAS